MKEFYHIFHKFTCISPSGVLEEIVAAGPVPALVMALTLNVYEVEGVKLDTSMETSSA